MKTINNFTNVYEISYAQSKKKKPKTNIPNNSYSTIEAKKQILQQEQKNQGK